MVNLKKKLKREIQQRKRRILSPSVDSWADNDGLHFVGQGAPPTSEDYKEMTKTYQAKIRNSPMWDQWVKQFGKEKAEEMLKECVAKPG
jgi:hypothetical protein